MRANVYIDGFNLYYRCVKDTAYRWLDLATISRLAFPEHSIHRIRYFTARVGRRGGDPQKPQRQQVYLRALETIPNLSIHYGHFLWKEEELPLAKPRPEGPTTATVVMVSEKRSDVNLASYLLTDGFRGEYEAAIVVTNDSDFMESIKLVRSVLGRPVYILSPQQEGINRALRKAATSCKAIDPAWLEASQLPDTLTDEHGTITKPKGW